MPTRLTIAVGQKIVMKDGLNEWARIYEGVIYEIRPIGGTSLNEVLCDPPMRMEVG